MAGVGLILACFGLFYWNWRQEKMARADKMLKNILANCKKHLEVEPDPASIVWLSRNYVLTARIWEILGMSSYEISQERPHLELKRDLESKIPYARFKEEYPAAAAVFNYCFQFCEREALPWS